MDNCVYILSFELETGCRDCCCAMTSGSGLNRCWTAKPGIAAGAEQTIDCLLKRYSGWREPALRGAIYHLPSDRDTVFRRFSRWADKGVWQTLFSTLCEEADFEEVRQHHCAGAPACRRGPARTARGRPRGTAGADAVVGACGHGGRGRMTRTPPVGPNPTVRRRGVPEVG